MPAARWPRHYPALDDLRARASCPEGWPLVAAEEDRLAIFAAEAVAGADLAHVAHRVRRLLGVPGVLERSRELARAERWQALLELVADPDALDRRARRGRLSYP